MDLSDPISSVIPSSHGPVLEVLARTDVPLSGRTVASLTRGRVSQKQTNLTLRALVASGLVLQEAHPPANLYRLNRDHVAAGAVVSLASLRDLLLGRMRAALGAWGLAPEAAWLFGSLARGAGDVSSDVDVLVLRSDDVADEDSDWVRQVDTFSDDVRRWSGNECTIVDYTRAEFMALAEAGERLPSDIARDGIHLAGSEIPRSELRGASS